MTSRPRSIPFQKVDISSRQDVQRPPDAVPAKLKFSDLLKNRRPAGPTGPAEPEDRDEDEALSQEAESADSDSYDLRPIQDLPPKQDQQDNSGGPDSEWLESIVPTPEGMEPVLEESRRAGLARANAVAAAQPAHPLVQGIAQTVTRFCNEKAVDESEGWQVRMPLNRDVLPDTVMQLAISPYWLQLRFETADELSRNMLITHRDALTQMIGDSLNRRRDVAISID